MLPIHLILSGPQEASYPNGGDEAYWMGQVAGALAGPSPRQGGFPWRGGCPRGGWLHFGSFLPGVAPQREGRQKGPALLWRPGDALGRRRREAIAFQLAQVYPQPELITLEEALLESLPGPGVAVYLLYRDNPQDEAWLARSAAPPGRLWPRAWAPWMAEALSSLLWGWHVLGGILAAGAFFTVATGFYQLRCLGRWMKAALRPRPGREGSSPPFRR